MESFVYLEYMLYGQFHHKVCTSWDEVHAELFCPDCEGVIVEEWKYNRDTREWVA